VNPKDIPRKSALNATSCANLDFHGMKCKNVEHVYGTSVHIINQKVLGCIRNHSDLLLYINIGYPTEANKQCNHPRMSGRDMVKSAYRLCLPSLRKSIKDERGKRYLPPLFLLLLLLLLLVLVLGARLSLVLVLLLLVLLLFLLLRLLRLLAAPFLLSDISSSSSSILSSSSSSSSSASSSSSDEEDEDAIESSSNRFKCSFKLLNFSSDTRLSNASLGKSKLLALLKLES
jgi:hypothetical protein